MNSEYVTCQHSAEPENISELEPLFSDGSEYLVRVLFREGDRQWGQYMTAKATELARVLFASALVLLVLLPGWAAAQSHVNGTETVGQFRTWPENVQLGYILGVRSYLSLLGLRCERPTTNGEALAALKYDARFTSTDSLPKALFLLNMRDGCEIPESR